MDTPRLLLEHYLKQLRLPTILREFPKLGEQCAKEGATFEQFLLRLVEQEMMDRERRATERRINAARFPVSKSLETYDFLSIPSLNKKLVLELARCEWIGKRENVLALGNSQSANFARSAVSRNEKPLPTCSNSVPQEHISGGKPTHPLDRPGTQRFLLPAIRE